MTKPVNLKLNLGNPEKGWLPIEFKSNDFELVFRASNIPENPTDKLGNALILILKGIESEIFWNLEPECYFFELKLSGKGINLIILKSNSLTGKRKLIRKLTGDFDSVILPMYRGLKTFNTLDFDTAHWKKPNLIQLKKLTKLVTARKRLDAQNR